MPGIYLSDRHRLMPLSAFFMASSCAPAMPSLNARPSGWDTSTGLKLSKNRNSNAFTRITTVASISGSSPTSSSIPKLEPFSRSRSSHWMKEPSLLEKAKHALSDECVVLDGDDSYRCWQALFELENIKEAYEVQCDTASADERHTACQPLERLENFVRQSGGVSTLIDNLCMLAESTKRHRSDVPKVPAAEQNIATGTVNPATEEASSRAPKIEASELEQQEQSEMMPDSPFTRLLRRRGHVSSWFSPCPEH